jgi:hypothetical protein
MPPEEYGLYGTLFMERQLGVLTAASELAYARS